MGKINELIERVKGLFNKNKTLPEGRTTSEHNNFRNTIKIDTKNVDLNKIPREDAIMKILESQGLNPKFAKNPESKEQIVTFIKQRVEKELFVKNSDICDIKTLENFIKNSLNNPYTTNMTITDEGNFKCSSQVSKEGVHGIKDILYTKKAFSFHENALGEEVLAVETTQHSDHLFDKYKPQRSLLRSTKYSTYDQNGVEMSSSYREAMFSYRTYMDRNAITNESLLKEQGLTCLRTDGYSLDRNIDMVTAKYTSYSSIDPNTLRPTGPSSRPVTIDLLMQSPEKLQPKETPYYQKINSGYVPESKNSKDDIEECAKKSNRFSKTAKSFGLISRTL